MATLKILGSCSGTEPMPERHHTSIVLTVNDRNYFFDAGENCSYSSHLSGVDLTKTRAVFISHTHFDHIGGLMGLFWVIRKVSGFYKRPVNEILEGSNKLYTVLKIDEVNNLGAVRIRIRSLISAMEMRRKQDIKADPKPTAYRRTEYTQRMKDENYTILAPQMLPIHFDILEPVFRKHGYNLEILKNDNRKAIDTGLKYVNNDACFPSITVVGQFMEAVTSGRYDTDKLAIFMTQTGGCCRASNYIGFIRRALDKAGYSHIPVISLSMGGIEKNEGFQINFNMVKDAVYALLYAIAPAPNGLARSMKISSLAVLSSSSLLISSSS